MGRRLQKARAYIKKLLRKLLRRRKNKVLDLSFLNVDEATQLDSSCTLETKQEFCFICKNNEDALIKIHGEQENYFINCQDCQTIYCFFCFDKLSNIPKHNQCWICENRLDPNKPFIEENEDNDDDIIQEEEDEIQIINQKKK